jgi:thiamine-phosphate pyrophosphorylase
MKFYIVSPPGYNKNFSAENFDKVTDLISVEYFQFRPKFSKLLERKKFIKKFYNPFSKICKNKNIKLIINNDFEIATDFFFDGIHLGQNDKSCSDAKEKFGRDFIVGISCSNSYYLYKIAKKDRADYIAFGPTFKSKTKKKKAISLLEFNKFKEKISLPYVFIGGINHSNIKKLIRFKPNNVAIIDSLWNFKQGPVQSALKFKENLEVS